MADSTREFIGEVYAALGLDRDKVGQDAQNALFHTLDDWRDEVATEEYDEGYEEGKQDAKPEEIFPEVDGATLDNLETGLDILKKGDTLSAPVYLDRALRDFGSRYY